MMPLGHEQRHRCPNVLWETMARLAASVATIVFCAGGYDVNRLHACHWRFARHLRHRHSGDASGEKVVEKLRERAAMIREIPVEAVEWRDGKAFPAGSNAGEFDRSTLAPLRFASPTDLDDALAAAEQGFKVWSRTSPAKRAEITLKAVQLVRERSESATRVVPKGCSATRW